MPPLKPTFTLTVDSLRTTTAKPVAGPVRFLIERDMDIAADALTFDLRERGGIGLDDAATLHLGHDGDEQGVFTGKVVDLRLSLVGVTVRALGTMGELLNLRTASTYESQTIGAIIRDLAGQAGLTPGTVDDGPLLPRYAVDSRISAWAHARDLADRLGFELYTDRDGKVMFHAPGDGQSGGGLLGTATAAAAASLLGVGGGESYAFAKQLLAARADRLPAAWQAIDVGGESPASGQGEETAHWLTTDDSAYRGHAGSGDPRRLVLDPAARTKDLADQFAAGRLAIAARHAYATSVRLMGRASVDLGDAVSVTDVSDDLLNGSGYIRAIRHRFDALGGFVTDLRMVRGAGA
jgi:phage protein D